VTDLEGAKALADPAARAAINKDFTMVK
jgi:hypothetical protein